MEAFKQLRQRAAERRDRAYKLAKDEYELALARIAELEQLLIGTHVPGRMTTAKAIESVIPDDRPFTTADVMAGLTALNPDRDWRPRAIDNQLHLLRKKGKIRRLRAAGNKRRALFIRTDVNLPPLPFENMALVDVIGEVLAKSDQPLTQTEIVVRILEQGYETDQPPNRFRNAVGTVMRGEAAVFSKGTNGRWAIRRPQA